MILRMIPTIQTNCVSALEITVSRPGPPALAGAQAEPGWWTDIPCEHPRRLKSNLPLTAGSTAVCYSINEKGLSALLR